MTTLEEDENDRLALYARTAAAFVPYFGPLFSEVVNEIIPNQRVERLVNFVRELEERLYAIEDEVVKKRLLSAETTALAEDAFTAAARAASLERTIYIATLMTRSLSSDDIDALRQRHLLSILSEINDEEVIWLRFYLHPGSNTDHEFRSQHAKILAPARPYIGGPKSEVDDASFKESYKDHLERLNLIKRTPQLDKSTGMPIYEKSSSKLKTKSTSATHLGRLLLREIGLNPE